MERNSTDIFFLFLKKEREIDFIYKILNDNGTRHHFFQQTGQENITLVVLWNPWINRLGQEEQPFKIVSYSIGEWNKLERSVTDASSCNEFKKIIQKFPKDKKKCSVPCLLFWSS